MICTRDPASPCKYRYRVPNGVRNVRLPRQGAGWGEGLQPNAARVRHAEETLRLCSLAARRYRVRILYTGCEPRTGDPNHRYAPRACAALPRFRAAPCAMTSRRVAENAPETKRGLLRAPPPTPCCHIGVRQ